VFAVEKAALIPSFVYRIFYPLTDPFPLRVVGAESRFLFEVNRNLNSEPSVSLMEFSERFGSDETILGVVRSVDHALRCSLRICRKESIVPETVL
jgi:hypothetical protein